jgi:hypothetical protein
MAAILQYNNVMHNDELPPTAVWHVCDTWQAQTSFIIINTQHDANFIQHNIIGFSTMRRWPESLFEQ